MIRTPCAGFGERANVAIVGSKVYGRLHFSPPGPYRAQDSHN